MENYISNSAQYSCLTGFLAVPYALLLFILSRYNTLRVFETS